MVDYQLKPRGIHDPLVLDSLARVPRHDFVPEALLPYAYEDGPLKIESGQTISQPYIVALMAQTAKIGPDSKVLEIGTGSGYGAAVLSLIARQVFTVERLPELCQTAKQRFIALGYDNIQVKEADGTLGWPEQGPFDAIIVTAAAPQAPPSLLKQLGPLGRLIIPLGTLFSQELVRIQKTSDVEFQREFLGPVRFVPLIGDEGWKA